MLKTKKTIKDIKEYLRKERVGDNVLIFHRKNSFNSIYNDHTAASWGWISPIKYDGYRVVWLNFSPAENRDKQTVMFDYITEKKYNKKYD